MNKAQLIEALAKAENITLKKAEMVSNALFKNMADASAHEERIEIRGFGSFKVKGYKGYQGRNPKTGDLIKVDGKKLPFFKVARNYGNASIAEPFTQPGRVMGGGAQRETGQRLYYHPPGRPADPRARLTGVRSKSENITYLPPRPPAPYYHKIIFRP
jgi:integration host factor subunit beta